MFHGVRASRTAKMLICPLISASFYLIVAALLFSCCRLCFWLERWRSNHEETCQSLESEMIPNIAVVIISLLKHNPYGEGWPDLAYHRLDKVSSTFDSLFVVVMVIIIIIKIITIGQSRSSGRDHGASIQFKGGYFGVMIYVLERGNWSRHLGQKYGSYQRNQIKCPEKCPGFKSLLRI